MVAGSVAHEKRVGNSQVQVPTQPTVSSSFIAKVIAQANGDWHINFKNAKECRGNFFSKYDRYTKG